MGTRTPWVEEAREAALAELGQAMQTRAAAEARITFLRSVLDALAPAAAVTAGGQQEDDGPGAGTATPPQHQPGLRVVPEPERKKKRRADEVLPVVDAEPERLWTAAEIADALGIPKKVRSLRGSLNDMVRRGELDRPGEEALYRSVKSAGLAPAGPGAGRERAGAAGGRR